MILQREMELLKRANKLIESGRTGRPSFFSRQLGISERRLYEVIQEMKAMGAPIEYSDTHRTYYYIRDCEVKLECSFRCLNEDETRKISGGEIFSKIFPLLLFFRSEMA